MASPNADRRPRASIGSLSPTSPSRTASSSSLLQCNCGRTFTRVENLRRHQRSHEDSRRLACSICGRTFNRPDVLKRHLRTHRGPSASARSGDSPPRAVQNNSSSTPSVLDSGRQTSGGSSPREHELPPATYSYRHHEDRRHHDRRRRGDLPSIDSLLPGPSTFDVNSPISRIPPSFPLDAPLPLPNLQHQHVAWDHSLLWNLQDSALELAWGDFATLEAMVPASVDTNSGFSFQEALRPSALGPRHSNEGRPQNKRQRSGDEWPNHDPKRAYVPGAEGRIAEVVIDPALDPKLWRWSRFWLDENLYAKVKSSLNLAQSMPGRDTKGFRMPESLFTVNTLISNYFNHFYPQLPVLHLPIFSIANAPPLLVSGMICIGASVAQIPGSRPFTVDLIEINRRTLTSLFEMDSYNLQCPHLVHALLLNIVAGISVGHQRSYEFAELSRGLLVQMCRKMHLLHSPVNAQQLYSSLPSALRDLWRFWIDMESRKRLGISIFLVDSMFPSYLDMPSYLSQGEMLSTALPCDDRLWAASSPEEWASLLGHSVLPPSTFFVAGVSALLVPRSSRNAPPPVRYLNQFGSLCLINALHHHIYEFRSQLSVYQSIGVVVTLWRPDDSEQTPDLAHGFEGRRRWLEDALDAWRVEYYDSRDSSPLSVSGRILYHLGHIALRAHLRDLYAVAGKHGTQAAPSVVPALKVWVRSADAPIAAEHAVRLLSAANFPQPSDNRHSPPGVFLSILVLWIFLKYHGAAIHHTFDTAELMRLLGTVPSAYSVLKGGLRYMVNNTSWKVCSAFAMVLAKMVDRDEAPSPHIHSPQSTRSI